ncbi:MAG: hypothetical protein RJA38_1088, partial [Bacteroidota bacterium]
IYPEAMKRLFLFLVLSLSACGLFAQASSATALAITPGNYLLNAVGYTPIAATNQCLVATTSQVTTACTPTAPTAACWFKFTVPAGTLSAAVKIVVVPTGFDASIDFFAGTAAAPIYKECVNAGGSGVTETLKTTWANNPVNPGTEYYFRVGSSTSGASCFTVRVEYYPTAQLLTSPNPSPDAGLVGYRTNNFAIRNNPSIAAQNNLVTSTRYRFVDQANPTGAPCIGTTGASNTSQAYLYSFPCICYGKTYDVYIEIQMDGIWCGEGPVRTLAMEAYPNNTISNAPCATLTLLGGVLNSTYLGSTAITEWEFSFGGTVVTTVQSSPGITTLNLNNSALSCLRYNRIYSVRIRMNYCNVWGQWSAPYCLITAPIPYLTVTGPPPAYANICNTTISPYSIVYSQFTQGANQYIWQIAQVNPAAPQTPIAPAIVATTAVEVLMLNQFALTPGNSYRIGVKPKLTTCNSPQEGDYGQFCVVTIGSAFAPNTPSSLEMLEEEIHSERNAADITEVDEQGNVAVISFQGIEEKMATVKITDERALGKGMIQLVSMNGQMLFSRDVFIESLDELIQLPLPSDVASGLYMVSFRTQKHTVTEKFWVR